MELHPYICKCCGGRINVTKMLCEYCGTQYENERMKNVEFIVSRPGVRTIRTEVRVDQEMMLYSPDQTRDYILKDMREQLAEALLGLMEVRVSRQVDHRFMLTTDIIRGEIRVVDPTCR